ncbi:MAG TPA: branched-chain amino acid transaminase [Candidatus Acidoferrales bacterium]|jgi:branched-chain amino acid aminotransferase|nr:branched-chain amino acid transaminase [Candidatus Acidoferrales bacterium]
MSVAKTEKIWHNGKFISWDDAKIHVMCHVVNYGSGVFEGVRCYHTEQGPAIFRLREHMQRLLNSAHIYRMDPSFSLDDLCKGALDLVQANKLEACYVRPIVFRGYGDVGVDPMGCPVEVYMACWEWGKYLGDEAIKSGIDVCVSSWNRPAPNTLPQMAKAVANYMNSQLIRMEAKANGYAEGIALDVNGHVSEGSGENIFVVSHGVVAMPPFANSALPGITRDSVITICRDLGIPVVEQTIPREALYIADEVFFSGTAAEITPVRTVDRIKVGAGSRGPVTKRIQEEFFALVTGKKPDRHNWLSPVGAPAPALR